MAALATPDVKAAPAGTDRVEFETAALVSGTRISSHIYDSVGMLMLAEGSVITPRFKELLVSRDVPTVMLSSADANSMRVRKPAPSQPVGYDSQVIGKLDALVDGGRLFMEDASPKFKDRLTRHGCAGHDPRAREQLAAQHAETCTLLDGMIKAAAHGEGQNGGDIATVISEYLSHLTLDADLVHDVTASARDYAAMAQHSLEFAILGMALAIEMNLGEDTVRIIGLSGLLHDWGMIQVPREIRESKQPLTDLQFLEVAKHPIYTANILERVTGLPPLVSLICYQVHERPDGTGYPRKRQGSSIHPCARILGVADTYIALTSPRPWRAPLKPHAAMECMLRQAARNKVDREVVGALLRILTLCGIGRQVKLSDGSKAVVRRRNGDLYHLPIVQIVEKADGTPTDPNDESLVIDPASAGLAIERVLPLPGREELDFSDDLLVLSRRRVASQNPPRPNR